MKIALIMPARTQQWGGVQRFASALHGALTRTATVESIRLHPDVEQTRNAWTRLEASIRGLTKLYSAHRRQGFDAVVSTFHWPFKLVPGIPMVGFVHDLRLWKLNGHGLPQQQRTTVAAVVLRSVFATWDAAFVPSAHVAADVKRLVPSLNVLEVGEGLDHLGVQTDRENGSGESLLVIAGHAPHKRPELGLRVAERMCQELGCSAIVLGKLPRAPRDSRVEVHEHPTDEALAALYKRARVAIAPTSYEGFGLAAGEAMWFGVPVVYARDGMLGGLIQSGGVAAEPTVDDFMEAVRLVWTYSDEYSREASAVARAYTWTATASRMLSEISRLVPPRCNR